MKTAQQTALAPFEIWEVPFEKSTIKFHKPLVLQPEWLPDDPDEYDENDYLTVKCPELNIDVFAENRDDLLEFVYSDIDFVWQHIVLVDDAKLDAPSRIIKKNYLKIAEAVDG